MSDEKANSGDTHPQLTWKQRKTCLKKSHEKVIKGYYYRVQHQHQPRFAKKTDN
jgi:hypothetical protein